MADERVEVDRVTGTATTGHVWDDIRELNTPLPRWWLWLFYLTIIWAIGYWVAYPAWPLVSSFSRGVLDWNSRQEVVSDLDGLKAQRAPMVSRLEGANLQQIVADTALFDFARAQGRTAFAENCAACHGSGGAGARGYPNLNDDKWIWGGTLTDIAQTIRHGIRAEDEETRRGVTMPAFGRNGMLTRAQIETVVDYVRSLNRLPGEANANLALGKQIYAQNCAVCHGDDAKGSREKGAPNLSDGIWLYGADRAIMIDGLWNGRGGVMPAWAGRLDEVTIKALAVYVYSFGGGEN
jgi:cytochrome c oxidase cbb3-type subunit 3